MIHDLSPFETWIHSSHRCSFSPSSADGNASDGNIAASAAPVRHREVSVRGIIGHNEGHRQRRLGHLSLG